MRLSREGSNSVKKYLDILRLDTGNSIDSFRSVQKKWEENPYKITTELLKSLENKKEEQQLRINIANFFHRNENYKLLNSANSKLKQPISSIKKMIIDSFIKIIKDKKEDHTLREKIIRGFTSGFLFYSPYSQSYKADIVTLLTNIASDNSEKYKNIQNAAKETLTLEENGKWIPWLYNTENNNFLTIGKLAEASGIRQTTIKYYTEIGILPFSQDGERLTRKYKEKEALERLKKIKELREKRLTIKEIIDHFDKSTKEI